MVFGENGVTGPLALKHVVMVFKKDPACVTIRFLSMTELIVLTTFCYWNNITMEHRNNQKIKHVIEITVQVSGVKNFISLVIQLCCNITFACKIITITTYKSNYYRCITYTKPRL